MEALKCPNCSAPAHPAAGQPTYQCSYCGVSFATGLQPPQPPPAQGPTIIVLDPGFHHQHSHVPIPVRAVSRGIGSIIRLFVIFTIVAAAGGFTWISRMSSFASSMVWDGTAPFQCGGNDNISVKSVSATFNAGTAISVTGNCHFTCTDCTIKAPTVIEVGGNGSVTIVNGTVNGSETLVDASGNARVNISGNVSATGAVKQSANARVSAPRPVVPPVPVPVPPPTPVTPVTAHPAAPAPHPAHSVPSHR